MGLPHKPIHLSNWIKLRICLLSVFLKLLMKILIMTTGRKTACSTRKGTSPKSKYCEYYRGIVLTPSELMTAHLGPGSRWLVLVPGSALQRVAETGGGLAAALRPAVEDLGDSPRQLELPRPDVAQDGGPVRAGLTEMHVIIIVSWSL